MPDNHKNEFHGLRFTLSSEWHRIDRPDKPAKDYQVRLWRAQKGGELHIAHWSAPPRTDGGIMVIAHQWNIVVAGQKTKLLETSTFQGARSKVLVVFLAKGNDGYRIHATGQPRDLFQTILSTMSFAK